MSKSFAAENHYSDGLSAYIDGNYELAQSLWLKAAKKDDYRAMFNLGLLHQQKKIPNADDNKAIRWFRLSGQGGYAAADYHHANWLVEQGGDESEIRRYLQRAANNGYYLAAQSLGVTPAATVPPVDVEAAKPEGTGAQSLALEYLGEDWLRERNSSGWTIQILAFTQLAKVKEFIDLHRLHDRAAYFTEERNNEVLYKLVYGEFSDKETADQARADLKPALQEHGPWLRTIASVQNVIKD